MQKRAGKQLKAELLQTPASSKSNPSLHHFLQQSYTAKSTPAI
jgi:hypothetical protein